VNYTSTSTEYIITYLDNKMKKKRKKNSLSIDIKKTGELFFNPTGILNKLKIEYVEEIIF